VRVPVADDDKQRRITWSNAGPADRRTDNDVKKSASLQSRRCHSELDERYRRRRTDSLTYHELTLDRRGGRKKLGFSVVGGRNTPLGPMGIYIKTISAGGLAADDARLQEGTRELDRKKI